MDIFTEFIFGIHQNQISFLGNFSSPLKKSPSVLLQFQVVGFTDNTLFYNCLPGNILVVSLISFGGRGNDRGRKSVILDHSLRHIYPT